MSIILNEYIVSKNLKPNAPAWFRLERYDYCERLEGCTSSTKRGFLSRIIGKKHSK